jgi:hypothetical protein
MIMAYIPPDATLHKKQEYIWIRGGYLNSFQNVWALPVQKGTGIHRMIMIYMSVDAP